MILTPFHFNRRSTRIIIWFYIMTMLISCTIIKLYYLGFESKNTSQSPRQRHTDKSYYQPYKYILVWPNVTKFKLLEKGDKTFVRNNCEYSNCFATDDVHFLSSVKDFDAVVFNGADITVLQKNELLKERSPKQKYIFAAYESAAQVPMCFEHFDGLFNLTWTYKLDSDFVAKYFNIYDLKGKVIGPRVNMKWLNKMRPINKELISKLSKKTKTAVWFVSRCVTLSQREDFVKKLRVQLVRFGLTVDIYGECGPHKCPRNESKKCNEMIKKDYFFYLAFENSWSLDYVTEKLSRALNNYAVPIVFGGANYTRFVPEDTYLDAVKLGAQELAYKINEVINNKTAYHDFFRWRNHYAYHSAVDAVLRQDVCQLCATLNSREQMSKVTVLHTFREWWNEGSFDCRYHEVFY